MLESLRQLLRGEALSGSELAKRLGLSQPTLSRRLTPLPEQLLKVNQGRNSRYHLLRPIGGKSCWPVYRITAYGQAEQIAELYSVWPQGYVSHLHNQHWQHSDSLPWWMADMRPQGFMGRALARQLANEFPDLARDPREWSDDETLRMLTTHPHDGVGNLLIGNEAYQLWLTTEPQIVGTEQLAMLAEQAMAGGFGGSSAGGEQPKFACCLDDADNHNLVKFSAPLEQNNAAAQRWADLLIAEHEALRLLQQRGIRTAHTRLQRLGQPNGKRQFLLVERFDREGKLGRHGVVSLRILDAEFVGKAHQSWPVIVTELAMQGVVSEESRHEVTLAWCFGRLIANTDMHAGNVSFIHDGSMPLELAPIYDMLPMAFAPASNGEMRQAAHEPVIDLQLSGEVWRTVLPWAMDYWDCLASHTELSDGFRQIAVNSRQQLDTVTQRINRMA